MFKKLFIAVAGIFMASAAMAQTASDLQAEMERREYKQYKAELAKENTWGYTRYQTVGILTAKSFEYAKGGASYGDVDSGLGVQFGNSFLTKNSIFDIIKLGFDITWLDLTGIKFKNNPGDSSNDKYYVSAGLGLGLSFHAAPFAKFGSLLQPLRARVYGRVVPSYTAIICKDDDDSTTSGAFSPVLSYGLGVDYKAIGVGLEVRSGEAKYESAEGSDKVKIKNTQTRLFVAFHF